MDRNFTLSGERKNIFIIVGSASKGSANEKLVRALAKEMEFVFNSTIFNDLKSLPHFDPDISIADPPPEIVSFREKISRADGIIICTPEYVFSIPSGLKNAIEWCIATTVFSGKPTGIITASAHGEKGHEELLLIMRTVMAKLTGNVSLRIPGIKGKMNQHGQIVDPKTREDLTNFSKAFIDLVYGNNG